MKNTKQTNIKQRIDATLSFIQLHRDESRLHHLISNTHPHPRTNRHYVNYLPLYRAAVIA